jgi:trans-2,3-dihydro-3-hydroxyanthranilate isomerase
MAQSYRYLHFDVFTDRLFGGNQLAVFPDARGLSDGAMQAIAKEMNFSESTFVLPPERTDTDVRLRIFTPAAELPMAGHPTIGSTFALARIGVIEPGRDRFVFGLGVGPTSVALRWKDAVRDRIVSPPRPENGRAQLEFAWMTQLNPTFSEPIRDRAGAAAILGLPESALALGLPPQVVSCGVPCLLVPLATRRDVDRAYFDRAVWETFWASNATRAICVFLFSLEPGSDGATAYSRMFAPDLGVGEDPATGGASGPLGSYLVEHNLVAADQAQAMLSLQGVKMGRPSHVHMSISLEHGKITSVRVGGQSVFAGEGVLNLGQDDVLH